MQLENFSSRAGSSFAFPSQTLYVESGSGLDAERTEHAEREVAQWRDHNALYLPRFPAEKISELHGTVEYPPPGSPGARSNGSAGNGREKSKSS